MSLVPEATRAHLPWLPDPDTLSNRLQHRTLPIGWVSELDFRMSCWPKGPDQLFLQWPGLSIPKGNAHWSQRIGWELVAKLWKFDMPNPKRSARLGPIFLCQSVQSIRNLISALSIIHPVLKQLPPPPFLPSPGFSLRLPWSSDYSCSHLGGQGGTKPIDHFICHQLLRSLLRVFLAPLPECL